MGVVIQLLKPNLYLKLCHVLTLVWSKLVACIILSILHILYLVNIKFRLLKLPFMFIPLLAFSCVSFVLHLEKEIAFKIMVECCHFINLNLGLLCFLCTHFAFGLSRRSSGLGLGPMPATVSAHINVFDFRSLAMKICTQIFDVWELNFLLEFLLTNPSNPIFLFASWENSLPRIDVYTCSLWNHRAVYWGKCIGWEAFWRHEISTLLLLRSIPIE